MAQRTVRLDSFRGLAVLLMLEVHLGYWWLRGLPDNYAVELGTVLGGTAAPLFLTVSGAAMAMSHTNRPGGFLKRNILRGILLLVCGVVFTALEQAVYGTTGWGILQCIGVSAIVSAFAMRLKALYRAIAGITVISLAPVMRLAVGVPGELFSDDLTAVFSAQDYLRHALVAGFFPLFPWTGVMLVGTAIGELLLAENPKFRHAGYYSLFLVLLGAVFASRGDAPVFFPPSLSLSFLTSGICCFALTLAARYGKQTAAGKLLAPCGRISLTVFVLHHFIGFEAFRAAGLLHSFDVAATFLMVAASWALAIGTGWMFARFNYAFTLEWLVEKAVSKAIYTAGANSGHIGDADEDEPPGRASGQGRGRNVDQTGGPGAESSHTGRKNSGKR